MSDQRDGWKNATTPMTALSCLELLHNKGPRKKNNDSIISFPWSPLRIRFMSSISSPLLEDCKDDSEHYGEG